MEKNLKKFLIQETLSVKETMRLMDKNGEKVAFVTDKDNTLLGSLTDGDIRRWILANGSLKEEVKKIYNRTPKFVEENYDLEEVKKLMLHTKIEWIPVVNKSHQVVSVLIWDEVFDGHEARIKKKVDLPVVIMAGGLGARLEPFTRVLPKPLIPIKGRPIIELIMDKLNAYGIQQFYISVNYKSRIIQAYFEELEAAYKIHYITEHKPLGTAGCLKSLVNKFQGSLLVTNCDIIIESDYGEIVDFHEINQNDMTIIGSLRHFVVPYGICEIDSGGILKGIKEKPAYDFLINTGMYILNAKVLNFIPSNRVFHMTDLIAEIQRRRGKVCVFPISEKSWIDVGQWEEYHRSVKSFRN